MIINESNIINYTVIRIFDICVRAMTKAQHESVTGNNSPEGSDTDKESSDSNKSSDSSLRVILFDYIKASTSPRVENRRSFKWEQF